MRRPRRSPERRKRPWLFAALFVTLLTFVTSCSLVQLTYDNLAWIIVYFADDLLDLDPTQEKRLRASVDQALALHRSEAMPSMVASLRVAERYVSDGLTSQEVTELKRRALAVYDDIAVRTLPLTVDLLLSLSPEQIQHLRSEIIERNEKFARRHGLTRSPADRTALRAHRMADRLSFWLSNLRVEQLELLDKLALEIPDFVDQWHLYRTQQQERFFQLLNERDRASLTAHLDEWWIRQDGLGDASFLRSERTFEKLRTVLLRLDASFDEEQRSHLLWRIRSTRQAINSS